MVEVVLTNFAPIFSDFEFTLVSLKLWSYDVDELLFVIVIVIMH